MDFTSATKFNVESTRSVTRTNLNIICRVFACELCNENPRTLCSQDFCSPLNWPKCPNRNNTFLEAYLPQLQSFPLNIVHSSSYLSFFKTPSPVVAPCVVCRLLIFVASFYSYTKTSVWGVINISWLACSHEINSDLYDFSFPHEIMFWRVSVVGLVIRILTGRSGVLIPSVSDDFLFSKMSRQALEPTHPSVQWVPVFFVWDKAARCENNHLHPSIVEIQNE
jgi:hypothetical protein